MLDRARPRALAYSGPVADPRALAAATQVMIAAYTVMQLVLALNGGTRSTFFRQGLPISTPLFIGTIVVFLCWFRRCRLNAEVFAPGTHKYTHGFAVGGWFIPLAYLWIPRRVALDIWRANSPAGGAWLIDAWWVAWIAKCFGGLVAALLLGTRTTGYSLYEQAIGVVAAVLAVLVVRQITAGQHSKVRTDPAALPVAPTPIV